jgi:hypothetical protein
MQFCGVAGEIRSQECGSVWRLAFGVWRLALPLAFGSGDCPARSWTLRNRKIHRSGWSGTSMNRSRHRVAVFTFGAARCAFSFAVTVIKAAGTMATAVFGGAESGNKASLQTAPRLKVNRDSRRYRWAMLRLFAVNRSQASTIWTRASSSAVRNSRGGSASVTRIWIDVSGQI